MPRVQLRNHKVHYQQTGHGPDVVLIHGLSCNIAFWWFHVAEHLAHSRRVTAIDLRGHGFSGMTDTGYRAVDLAADVAALLDHLDVAGAHVVGHSFGGAVAAALAAERPDLVAELTLADAWLPSLQPVPPLQGSAEWAATRARAEARGIQIDPALPLVVRGLFSELLDEIDFLAGDHDDHAIHQGPGHWEVGAGAVGTGAGVAGRGSRLGRFWPAGGAGLRGGWGAATPRFLRRGAT
ncbi:MAG: alpha/beta fold hydrolase, partial [Rhodobacterales bacterium]|nr:alpha/beta fold hydrolase [Rhodobacterales bacterium]